MTSDTHDILRFFITDKFCIYLVYLKHIWYIYCKKSWQSWNAFALTNTAHGTVLDFPLVCV